MPGKTEIKSRIIKMEMVKWRDLKWFQINLKELSEEAHEKLKRSLVDNDFSMPFHVWQKGKLIWILDGHHRQRAMRYLEKEDGVFIPDDLPAVFLKCEDRREAAKMVLAYASTYAIVTQDGLAEFLQKSGLDWGELSGEFDFPGVFLNEDLGEYNPRNTEKEMDENIKTNMTCPKCGYVWNESK